MTVLPISNALGDFNWKTDATNTNGDSEGTSASSAVGRADAVAVPFKTNAAEVFRIIPAAAPAPSAVLIGGTTLDSSTASKLNVIGSYTDQDAYHARFLATTTNAAAGVYNQYGLFVEHNATNTAANTGLLTAGRFNLTKLGASTQTNAHALHVNATNTGTGAVTTFGGSIVTMTNPTGSTATTAQGIALALVNAGTATTAQALTATATHTGATGTLRGLSVATSTSAASTATASHYGAIATVTHSNTAATPILAGVATAVTAATGTSTGTAAALDGQLTLNGTSTGLSRAVFASLTLGGASVTTTTSAVEASVLSTTGSTTATLGGISVLVTTPGTVSTATNGGSFTVSQTGTAAAVRGLVYTMTNTAGSSQASTTGLSGALTHSSTTTAAVKTISTTLTIAAAAVAGLTYGHEAVVNITGAATTTYGSLHTVTTNAGSTFGASTVAGSNATVTHSGTTTGVVASRIGVVSNNLAAANVYGLQQTVSTAAASTQTGAGLIAQALTHASTTTAALFGTQTGITVAAAGIASTAYANESTITLSNTVALTSTAALYRGTFAGTGTANVAYGLHLTPSAAQTMRNYIGGTLEVGANTAPATGTMARFSGTGQFIGYVQVGAVDAAFDALAAAPKLGAIRVTGAAGAGVLEYHDGAVWKAITASTFTIAGKNKAGTTGTAQTINASDAINVSFDNAGSNSADVTVAEAVAGAPTIVIKTARQRWRYVNVASGTTVTPDTQDVISVTDGAGASITMAVPAASDPNEWTITKNGIANPLIVNIPAGHTWLGGVPAVTFVTIPAGTTSLGTVPSITVQYLGSNTWMVK